MANSTTHSKRWSSLTLIAALTLAACSGDDGDAMTSSDGTETNNTDDESSTNSDMASGDDSTDPSGEEQGDEADETDETEAETDTDGSDGLGETCDATVQMVPAAASPDGPKLEATITLPGQATVADVQVAVDLVEVMKASYLEIRLTHDGTTVMLYDQECVENKDIHVRFDDAAGPIGCCNNWVQCEGDPVTGDAAPVEPLSAFAGAPVGGDWTLEVIAPMSQDPFAAYQALLESWCLDIAG